MSVLEKTTLEISKIFKIINVVYDQTILCFDPIETVIAGFKEAYNLSCSIDVSMLKSEIISDDDDDNDFEEITDNLENELEQIIIWKPDITDIIKIKDIQKNDLIAYFNQLNHLEVKYTVQQKEFITDIFIKIGLRLLKARIDINKIIDDLKKIQELQEKINKLNACNAIDYHIKLAPDKLKDFTQILYRMYKSNFFLPVSNKFLITELDVIYAFQSFFDVEIIDAEWFTPDFYFETDNVLIPETKKAPTTLVESPEYIKKQLKNYFINQPHDSFLDILKEEFKQEKGKNMAILLHVLKNNDPVLLEIPYGKMKKLYTLLKSFFNTNIGSYQSIANYEVDERTHQHEINHIKERLALALIL